MITIKKINFMKSVRYTSSVLIYSLALAGGVFQSCSSSANKQKQGKEQVISVVTALPSYTQTSGVSASGQIEAGQTAMISTRLMGTINHIYVEVGDRVHKGQLLISVSNADLLAQRAQANASISEAKAASAVSSKDLERFTQLYKQQSASAKELENVTLQNQSVRSKLETARQMKNQVDAQLAYTHITAPFTGVITKKFMDEGSMANPGMPLLALEQGSNFQAVVNVSESDISKIKQGARVKVVIKSPDVQTMGIVSEISPSSQFSGGQYVVKISIADSKSLGIKAGMYVNVFIPGVQIKNGRSATMMIPVSAIVNNEQLTGIYTVSNDGKALLRWIRLGKQIGNNVEVLSGLAPTERFVVNTQGSLSNGCSVNISNK
jgi:RND family efflux transporter MFP subunit